MESIGHSLIFFFLMSSLITITLTLILIKHNGVAKRKHHHITENGLTLLAHASMPLKYQDEAFQTFILLINKLPLHVLYNQFPLVVLFHVSPNYSQLKVFGCACFLNMRTYNQHKLQFNFTSCTFLAYSLNHNGYKCLDTNGSIFISQDVIFNEHFPPFVQQCLPKLNLRNPI